MHVSFHDVLIFFTGVLVPTYSLLEWVVKHFGKKIKRLLIRTPEEAALYRAYKDRAMRKKV
jgi:hypothetical protein